MRIFTVILAVMLALLMTVAAFAQSPMKVGIATADITPAEPVYMAGYSARKDPSEGVYKDIYATCLVFDNGTTRVGLMALDLCKIGIPELAAIRQAAEGVGIPAAQMMINSSHTHCGPTIIGSQNAEYVATFTQTVCGLLQKAVDDLQPATMDFTVGMCTMGINRRQLNSAGHYAGMRPEPRKPIDTDVPILRVLAPDGKVRAVVFGYACHPTTIGGQLIGPDYPGPARDFVEAAYEGCTAVFLQGCGGDVKPRYVLADGRFGYAMGDELDYVYELGHELGRAVVAASGVPLSPVEGTQLGGILEDVALPDKTDPEKSHTIEMSAIRVGNVYIFGSQCELLVEIGLHIKQEMTGWAGETNSHVWVNGYTHWGGGYIPPAEAYPEGGYEVDASAVSPAAEGIIVGNAERYFTTLHDE